MTFISRENKAKYGTRMTRIKLIHTNFLINPFHLGHPCP